MGERYATLVLVRMLDMGGEVKFSDLSDIVTTFSTLNGLMMKLSDAGLVVTKRVNKPYKTNYAELTGLGFQVARRLHEIERILSGEDCQEGGQMDYDALVEQRDSIS